MIYMNLSISINNCHGVSMTINESFKHWHGLVLNATKFVGPLRLHAQLASWQFSKCLLGKIG